jgi:hypothetical protein
MSAADDGASARARRHLEVRVLLRAGHARSEIARLTGLSLTTIRRIAREPKVDPDADDGGRKRRAVGRPTKAGLFRGAVAEDLRRNPDASSRALLLEAKKRGYTGGKSAMYGLIAQLREEIAVPNLESDSFPGALSEHELASAHAHFVGGGRTRVCFLASRLSYSRWLEVTIVPGWGVEPLLRALVDHFAAMGGVPLLSVLRIPKRVPLQTPSGEGAEWHPAFAQAVLDLGIGVLLRTPADGKGAWEALASWVNARFFARRRFAHMRDLQAQLADWRHDVNAKIPSRSTRKVPAERMDKEERASLRPLRINPREFALRIPLVVGAGAAVLFEGVIYKAPQDTSGMLATVHVERTRLRIVVGGQQIDHERRTLPI